MKKYYYQGVHLCIKTYFQKTVANDNKIKFEPYSDLVDETCSCYNANILDNQDPFGQVENDETGEAVYCYDQDDENVKSRRNSRIPNFMPRFMVDHENLENTNYLDSKQYDV